MRRLALALAALAAAALGPAAGHAVVVPGPNGQIVFTSGRDDGATALSNEFAQIWILSGPGGGATRITTLELTHHRHPAWSPDRTKVAYARGGTDGTPFDGPWDIYVQDLTAPGSAPVQVTNTPTNEDRPSWSPDGMRLAYAKQDPVDSNWDIVTKAADGTGTETNIADLAASAALAPASPGQFSRPQWSPDGQTIYFARTIAAPPAAVNHDIYRTASDGSDYQLGNATTGTPLVVGPANDYQPALAPDGDNLCFTRQGSAGKDIAVAPSTGGPGAVLIAESGDEYECAWSPDDSKIAFVRGGFGAGEIRIKDLESDAPSTAATDVPMRFDGNPDWTYNPTPTCSNGSASVPFNGFVSIPLECTDALDPPAFPLPELELKVTSGPSNGVLGGIRQDGSVVYTPSANFEGTDSFTFTATDQTSTSTPATVTVNVAGPGPDATAADISDVTVSPLRWRRGPELPRFSARTGTRISWRLSEAARATLTFQRARPGRRVRGRCLRPTRARRARPRCTRFVSLRPSLTHPGAQAGLNALRFQGRLSARKRLPLGRYRVVVSAVDAAGNRSASERSRTFRIVAR